jgi:hypothetical protein
MYGLINMAIRQLVIDAHGIEGWQTVKNKASLNEDNFELLTVYDDSITYKLVKSASEVTGKNPNEILHLFGMYWVGYASKAGYEPLLKLFGPNFKECLANLNRMHEHMGAMMPGLIPPEFEISKEVTDTEFEILYKSQRNGLSPMVSGLLEALAQRYGISEIKIEKIQDLDESSCRFKVKWS